MRKVIPTTQYKKDFKKIRHDKTKVEKLLNIVRYLERGDVIPLEYSPHKLYGNYIGCMECHVESDFLLVWIDESSHVVRLIRLGSHSEIF